MASGLNINLSKSHIIRIGEVDDIGSLASLFGCRVAPLPMKYLGLLLGAPYKSTTIWNGIVENMKGGWRLEEALFVEGREVDVD